MSAAPTSPSLTCPPPHHRYVSTPRSLSATTHPSPTHPHQSHPPPLSYFINIPFQRRNEKCSLCEEISSAAITSVSLTSDMAAPRAEITWPASFSKCKGQHNVWTRASWFCPYIKLFTLQWSHEQRSVQTTQSLVLLPSTVGLVCFFSDIYISRRRFPWFFLFLSSRLFTHVSPAI